MNYDQDLSKEEQGDIGEKINAYWGYSTVKIIRGVWGIWGI